MTTRRGLVESRSWGRECGQKPEGEILEKLHFKLVSISDNFVAGRMLCKLHCRTLQCNIEAKRLYFN